LTGDGDLAKTGGCRKGKEKSEWCEKNVGGEVVIRGMGGGRNAHSPTAKIIEKGPGREEDLAVAGQTTEETEERLPGKWTRYASLFARGEARE